MQINQTSPDKGLLEALLGKNPEAAQAGIAAGQGDAMEQTSEDFLQALAKTQDQQAANAKAEQPKGGLINGAGKDEAAEKKLQATQSFGSKEQRFSSIVDAKANSQSAKAEEAAKAEKPKSKSAQNLESSATAAFVAAHQAQAQQRQELVALKPAAEGVSGVGAQPQQQEKQQPLRSVNAMAGSELKAQAESLLSAAKQASAFAEQSAKQAALSAQQAVLAASQSAQAQSGTQSDQRSGAQVVLQPIVLPMALMPVEVIDVDAFGEESEARPAFGGGLNLQEGAKRPSLLNSQDFLAQRGVLSAGRFEEGLVSRFGREGKKAGVDEALDAFSLPQVGSLGVSWQVPARDAARSENTSVVGTVEVATNPSTGRAELADTVALARQVSKLAAGGGGTVRVRVMPENLGELEIQVQKTGGKLDVRFEASSESAREALTGALPELRQMLTAARHDVGSLEVQKSAAGGLVAMASSPAGDAVSMMSFSSHSQFSDSNQNGGRNGSGQHQPGDAWDRYFTQQESRQQQHRQNQGGYRRYQEQAYA